MSYYVREKVLETKCSIKWETNDIFEHQCAYNTNSVYN